MNKHCLVTGGSSGLGLAIAVGVLKRGAKSVTLMARKKEQLDEAKASLQSSFPEAIINVVSVDVTNSDKVIAAFKQCEEEFGILAFDVVFACAGASKPGFFLQTPSEDFESSMRLNYYGVVYTLQVNDFECMMKLGICQEDDQGGCEREIGLGEFDLGIDGIDRLFLICSNKVCSERIGRDVEAGIVAIWDQNTHLLCCHHHECWICK